MTERQLAARIRYWQSALTPLGLAQWRFKVSIRDHIEDDVDEDPSARADTSPFYDDVEFSFKREAVERYAQDGRLDELIVHEWLHVVDRDHHHLVRQLLNDLASSAEQAMTVREEQARESRIDRMARLIVALSK